MKVFKLIFKISICWVLISLLVGVLGAFFTTDKVFFQVFAGVFSFVLLICLIAILSTFKKKYLRPISQMNNEQWTNCQQNTKPKNTNLGLLGIFLFIVSMNAIARTLRRNG